MPPSDDGRSANAAPPRKNQKKDDKQPSPWRVEGMPPSSGSGGGRTPVRRPPRFWATFGILLIANFALYNLFFTPRVNFLRVPYTVFKEQVAKENIKEVTSRGQTIQGKFKREVEYKDKKAIDFKTERPTFADDDLLSSLTAQGTEVNANPPSKPPSFFEQLMFGFGPTLLIVGLFLLLSRRMSGMGVGGFGRSRAKRYDETAAKRVTFDDVAGIDEAEEELVEVVDFLKNPQKYRKLGATIPKGVLLSGQPGTGKTLLARAVAGEANVPFFSMSASEFVEMIVGVGASRVRDLFTQAKAVAPAIIFIDELDAIGRSRSGGNSLGGHDEREQTLNQILTEMDGFTGSEGVIVLAATNRPEILDHALLRPGRFDRRVAVSPPDQIGRKAILEVHTKSVPLSADVDLGALASTTPGMVGADLRNLVNEAALLAARRGHEAVEQGDFTDAMEKILLGAERRIVVSKEERERTAYHESGHALLGMLQPGADPVRKISIVPRGRALGVTFQSPTTDRYSFDALYLKGRIIGALGGRAAEEVVYGNVTTGAENDLEQVTRIAKAMVGRWGMSPAIGPIAVLPNPGDGGFFPGFSEPVAQKTMELVDSEARVIVEECYSVALSRLREYRDKLEALAQALLARETLDEQDAYAVAGIARVNAEAAGAGVARIEPENATNAAAAAAANIAVPADA